MKKAITSGLVFAMLLGTLTLVAYATGGKGHGEENTAGRNFYHKAMKDMRIEVTNTDKGVIVTITSDDPKVVKLIQERWAKRMGKPVRGHKEGLSKDKEAHENGGCEHGEENSDEGKETHKSGKCTGHESEEVEH